MYVYMQLEHGISHSRYILHLNFTIVIVMVTNLENMVKKTKQKLELKFFSSFILLVKEIALMWRLVVRDTVTLTDLL